MSILEKLKEDEVFYIETFEDNTRIELWECRDGDEVHYTELNKSELNQLIEELKELSDKLED